MKKFSIKCCIPYWFLDYGKVCVVNQLFGENKNSLFYGPKGHNALDLKTRGKWKWKRHNIDGKPGFKRVLRNEMEVNGRIPIFAAHAGKLRPILYNDKEGKGWGIAVEAEWMEEDGKIVQYRTIYWHIETPWRSMSGFRGKIASIPALMKAFLGVKVKALTPIAIAGDNGMSTGPHTHFGLQRRVKGGGWIDLNPILYYDHSRVLFVRTYYSVAHKGNVHEWYYQGKRITSREAKKIKAQIAVTHY